MCFLFCFRILHRQLLFTSWTCTSSPANFDYIADAVLTVRPGRESRDHRMSLAEPVPFLRWRTTQLAKFELSWGLMHLMARKDPSEASKVLLLCVPVYVFFRSRLICLVLVPDLLFFLLLFLLRGSILARGQRCTLLLFLLRCCSSRCFSFSLFFPSSPAEAGCSHSRVAPFKCIPGTW